MQIHMRLDAAAASAACAAFAAVENNKIFHAAGFFIKNYP